MSFQHFVSLLIKNARIQQAIDTEHQRKAPDWIKLLKLKKIRLALRDRLETLSRTGTHGPLALRPVRVRTNRFPHYQ